MPTRKRRVLALENYNKNVLPDPNYEPLAGEGLAPMYVPLDEFEGQVRPSPFINDLEHTNDSLVVSRRLDRIARQMIQRGFKGD